MKKQVKKLTFSTEKIVILSKNQLQNAQGGVVPYTRKNTCFCL